MPSESKLISTSQESRLNKSLITENGTPLAPKGSTNTNSGDGGENGLQLSLLSSANPSTKVELKKCVCISLLSAIAPSLFLKCMNLFSSSSIKTQWIASAFHRAPALRNASPAEVIAATGEPFGEFVYSPGPANPSIYQSFCRYLDRPNISNQRERYVCSMDIFASVCGGASQSIPFIFADTSVLQG